MRTDSATRRIAAFERRRGEAHLVLACHCAVPLALTPDLTYRLWANFNRDVQGRLLRIPWVAVADLLLSRLCEEAGDELYEMDRAIRQRLLSRLEHDPRFGARRIGEVAEFMLQYVKQQVHSEDLDSRDFALAQEWNALAYTRPELAAHELVLALTAVDRRDRSELLRITSVVDTLSKPLESFDSLLVYADALRGFARGDQPAAAALLDTLVDEDRQIHIGGATMTIPHDLLPPSTERPPRPAGKRPAHPVRQRWALLVGVDRHDDPTRPTLRSAGLDALALQRTLNDLDVTTVTLHNDATEAHLLPTRANIEGELARLALAAKPGDLLLFFFSGRVLRSGPSLALVARDTRFSMPPTMITTNAIESLLHRSRAHDMVIILDDSASQERVDQLQLAAYSWQELSQWVSAPAERRAAVLATTGGHQGLFVDQLRAGLAGDPDWGDKGYVTVKDLAGYLRERLEAEPVRDRGTLYFESRDADIPLVELTGRTALPQVETEAEQPAAQPVVPVESQLVNAPLIFRSLREALAEMRAPDVKSDETLGECRWTPAWRTPREEVMLYSTTFLTTQSLYLYRGQVERYSPCLPSITRDLHYGKEKLYEFPEEEQIQFIVRQLRIHWFQSILASHPAIQWANSGKPFRSLISVRPELAAVPDLLDATLFVDDIALAQHYGLRTGFLDLTESVNVAAFFATNELLDGKWVPATDGWGVIYRFSVPRPRSVEDAARYLERTVPVGYQPFPRPNEQWAWVHQLGVSQDFETLPDVEAFMFPHIAAESRHWHQRFSGGSVLFPYDDLADVVNDVNNADELPADIADRLISSYTGRPEYLPGQKTNDILGRMRDQGINVSSDPWNPFTHERLDRMRAVWEDRRREFFESVCVRALVDREGL